MDQSVAIADKGNNAPSAQPEPMSSIAPICPLGHGMQWSDLTNGYPPDSSWHCDICEKAVGPGWRWWCQRCQCDVCRRCKEEKFVAPTAQTLRDLGLTAQQVPELLRGHGLSTVGDTSTLVSRLMEHLVSLGPPQSDPGLPMDPDAAKTQWKADLQGFGEAAAGGPADQKSTATAAKNRPPPYEPGGLARQYTDVRTCMSELQQLSMREVRKRAFAEGLVEDDLDEALDDADELGVVPKDSIIAAILRKMRDDPVQETRAIGLHPDFFDVEQEGQLALTGGVQNDVDGSGSPEPESAEPEPEAEPAAAGQAPHESPTDRMAAVCLRDSRGQGSARNGNDRSNDGASSSGLQSPAAAAAAEAAEKDAAAAACRVPASAAALMGRQGIRAALKRAGVEHLLEVVERRRASGASVAAVAALIGLFHPPAQCAALRRRKRLIGSLAHCRLLMLSLLLPSALGLPHLELLGLRSEMPTAPKRAIARAKAKAERQEEAKEAEEARRIQEDAEALRAGVGKPRLQGKGGVAKQSSSKKSGRKKSKRNK
eukprot:COSAG05_NODE_80_length_21046_cov_45.708325_5_plen_541_part_00